MYVGACGKKNTRDQCMTLDLVFQFDDEPSPKVVGKYCQNPNSTSAEASGFYADFGNLLVKWATIIKGVIE